MKRRQTTKVESRDKMLDSTKNLLDALSKTEVTIHFKSVNSGRKIEKLCTLQNTQIKQNPNNDTIVVYCLDTGAYEDIRVSTIELWIRKHD
jgi:hypothetical protein